MGRRTREERGRGVYATAKVGILCTPIKQGKHVGVSGLQWFYLKSMVWDKNLTKRLLYDKKIFQYLSIQKPNMYLNPRKLRASYWCK